MKTINAIKGGGGGNFVNRSLFHGDNLKFLQAINSECIDLIATDPPFNKGRDFHATPDSLAKGASFQDRWSWEKDVQEAWCDRIKDDKPRLMEAIQSARYAHSDGMGAFMCFLAVRLLEMHRVLKNTGSIYLHCDPTASHYIKACMDAIFGAKNFRNELVWFYDDTPGRPKRDFARKHDIIFRYAKTSEFIFNGDAVGIPVKPESLVRYKTARRIGGRKYIGGSATKIPESVWKFAALKKNSKQSTGYPTQKPIDLYERMIEASTNKGDVVLDPFCGCATTLIAAEKLKRKWIGMDLWKKAVKVVKVRLVDEGLAIKGEAPPKGRIKDLFAEDIEFLTDLPARTDMNRNAVVPFKTQERYHLQEPPGRQLSHKEMKDRLVARCGAQCQGCDAIFNHPRHLELDHNTPRRDGGLNHITNRVLLCGACNRSKSHRYTLSGLRERNKREGLMANQLAQSEGRLFQ